MPFVEWVSEPDPVETGLAQKLIAVGKTTKEQVWAFNSKRRQIVMQGFSVRILTPREGLSKTYQWGPERGSYVQFVTDGDWNAIQNLAEANTFVLAVEETGKPNGTVSTRSV